MSLVDDGEQLQLFGAGPGRITEVHLAVEQPYQGRAGLVRLTVTTEMRQDPMHLRITSLKADQMATAVGYVVPITLKSAWCTPTTMRAQMWALQRRLGVAGWEVSLRGCGAPPKR